MPEGRWRVQLLFAACLVFFLYRGPYRAIRYSTTGDFSTVYAAARCWLAGQNPYDRRALQAQLASAGSPASIVRDQDVNPSVYLPSALVFTAALAWLPWTLANPLWCVLLTGVFGWSLWLLLRQLRLTPRQRWLVASGTLLFSPSYVGIYDGNPSVLVIACLLLAVCFRESFLLSGLLLGVALAFKPQLAIGIVGLLALWKFYRPIWTSIVVSSSLLLAGVLGASRFGQNFTWWHAERQITLASFRPGGQSDPSPASPVAWQMLHTQTLTSYLFTDPQWAALTALALGLLLFAIYLRKREGDFWQDSAMLSALTLVVSYHRYYDAQLLLLTVPWVSRRWTLAGRALAPLVCLLVLAFPLQTTAARWLGARATVPSWEQFTLLRIQPIAVLTLAVALSLFSPSRNRAKPSSCSNEGR